MENSDYKTSESVDMKNSEAVKYAANELGITTSQYRNCAEKAGTYDRNAIKVFISRRFDHKKGCCW